MELTWRSSMAVFREGDFSFIPGLSRTRGAGRAFQPARRPGSLKPGEASTPLKSLGYDYYRQEELTGSGLLYHYDCLTRGICCHLACGAPHQCRPQAVDAGLANDNAVKVACLGKTNDVIGRHLANFQHGLYPDVLLGKGLNAFFRAARASALSLS